MTPIIASLLAFALVQLGDVYTTVRAINLGGTEGNPVVVWLMERLGMGWVLVKLIIAAGAAFLIVDGGALWLLWAITAINAYVVQNNYKILKRLEGRK